MQVSWWHHKSFHFHLSFWIWNLWKGKKIQKYEYLETEKSFLDKTFVTVFKGLSFGEKTKKNYKK